MFKICTVPVSGVAVIVTLFWSSVVPVTVPFSTLLGISIVLSIFVSVYCAVYSALFSTGAISGFHPLNVYVYKIVSGKVIHLTLTKLVVLKQQKKMEK